eukprot:16447286-Heterocapsa_arctica.AAC.1
MSGPVASHWSARNEPGPDLHPQKQRPATSRAPTSPSREEALDKDFILQIYLEAMDEGQSDAEARRDLAAALGGE